MPDDAAPRRVVFCVGIGAYEHLEALPAAASDARAIAERFGGDGFEQHVVVDKPHAELVGAFGDRLAAGSLAGPGTVLVVYWAGHAGPGDLAGSLRLLGTTNGPQDGGMKVVTAADLALETGGTGAAQVLVLIDACTAGGGVVDAAKVLDTIGAKVDSDDRRWFGVVASCRDYEDAVDGAFAKKLLELLAEGPKDRVLRLRWSSYQAGLRGDDLVDALVKEWDEDRQSPKQLSSGNPWFVMTNPMYRPGAPEQVVEHLLWAARGGTQGEVGNWFTGRERALRNVVGWVAAGEPGLCIVTGPAGCGKTAVAGRIVSLSSEQERVEIAAVQGLPAADLDPGRGAVRAHVQARGMTLERCAEVLAQRLGTPGVGRVASHHDVLAWAQHEASRPVIVLDGLDEADDPFGIAKDLVAPLATYARVLVASREAPPRDETEPSLLETLGVPAVRVDLEDDPDETDGDVHAYVVARLTDSEHERVHAATDPEAVAAEVVALARSPESADEGPFLLARILTSQLLSDPVDTSDDTWRDRLVATVEEAFERDLARGRRLKRGDEELPHAARELLSALAYSYGAGFPADDVWPAVATSLSPTGTVYDRLDAFWALGEYGRYVTASSLGGQAVYRLHQRLADTLRRTRGPNAEGTGDDAAAVVAQTVLDVYDELLESGEDARRHPYLWNYAWLHASAGGPAAIDALASLAGRAPELTPDVARASLSLSIAYRAAGRRLEALVPTERAVEIYEELAAGNPAFLSDLARSLNNLGVSLSEVGRRADAVAPTERAVEIFEELAAANPAFLNDLAGSLSNLGVSLSGVGRRADAVAPTERAVGIYEGLAAANPAFLNDLATSLNNLGIRFSGVGRRADAVAPTQRAVEIREELAAANPAFLNDLAMSLSNLGVLLSGVGRRADAVAPTERAVGIYEGLAAANPAFLNDLAMSLNNLGVRFSEVGRRAEAVAPTQRAVEIYEELAAGNPAFLNDLATSLNNLGNRLSGVGRRAEAVAPAERAVEIYEGLAAGNPAFLNDLAMSLNNLGASLSEVGRRAEAVAPTERAVEIREELAAGNPAFLNDLATSLSNLGVLLSGVGRRADAVAPTQRAVEIYEELAAGNPAFLNDLATSLSNLGVLLSGVGRRADAVAPTERAVEIREELAAGNPAFLNDLATSLSNLGVLLSGVGRRADAVAPTERAVEIREELAAGNPAFLNDLAGSLSNLGVLLSGVGRRADAVAPTQRAVEIREELAAGNPAFLNDLAGSLNNLGIRFSEVGRRADAVAPTQRAVQIYEELAAGNPTFLNDLATSLDNLGDRQAECGNESAGPERWRAVLARFEADPRASVVLRLARRRSDGEGDERIGDLIEAIELDVGADLRLLGDLHGACRAQRALDAARFDEIWRERVGSIEPWLLLDEATIDTCVAWMNLGMGRASHEYMASRAATLLSDEAAVALDEIALASAGHPLIDRARALRAACIEHGVDVAYGPLLRGELARDWRARDDPDDSRAFLDAHHDELVTPDAMRALEDDPVARAMLMLASRDRADIAYELQATGDGHAAALTEARRSAPADELSAIATICLAGAQAPEDKMSAAVHLAMALALAGQADDAASLTRQLRDAANPAALVRDVGDAIAHRPEHAVALAALLQVLTEPDADAAPSPEGDLGAAEDATA